jgi:PAS domain S-box-containing protein
MIPIGLGESFMQEESTQHIFEDYTRNFHHSINYGNSINEVDHNLNCPSCREQFFKLIAEFSEDWICWINPESKISFMSPACKLISGYDAEEFGDDQNFLKKIIHPKDLEILIEEEEKVAQGINFCSDEFRIIKKSSEVKWVSHFCQNVYDEEDKFLGRYVCIKDISEKMNPNLFLLHKDKLAQEIYQNASIGYYEIYYDGSLKSANKIFLDMLGYDSTRAFTDRNFEEYCVLNREKREEFKKLLKTNGKVKNFESTWIKKDWSIAYFKETANVVVTNEGLEPYYQVIVHNLTEQRNAEYAYMSASIKRRKIEELKAEFLATMSHEIRTPLNVILNMVSLLKHESDFIESSETNHSIRIIEEEGERIQRTINLILEMSQLQTGTYEKEVDELDLLDDVFKGIYKNYREKAGRKNIEFTLTNKLSNTKIVADKYGLNQIFNQLIDNALKYTFTGKIETLLYLNEQSQITIEVADTGIGINEGYIPYLFAVFSQEDNSYSRLFEGTGLGLAIVKKHCELNNAVIEVESKKNEGTRFRIKFTENTN